MDRTYGQRRGGHLGLGQDRRGKKKPLTSPDLNIIPQVCTNFDWGSGQPDSGTIGNCVVLYSSGYHWFDTNCGETFAFDALCEQEATGGD